MPPPLLSSVSDSGAGMDAPQAVQNRELGWACEPQDAQKRGDRGEICTEGIASKLLDSRTRRSLSMSGWDAQKDGADGTVFAMLCVDGRTDDVPLT